MEASNENRKQEAWLNLAVEVVREFGEVKITATGTSMLPAVFPGDVLTVHHHQGKDLEHGHIAVYMRDGRIFAHRVLKKTDTSHGIEFITRGDALMQEDPPAQEGDLLGFVTAIERGARRMAPRQAPSPIFQAAGWAIRRWDGVGKLFLRWHQFRSELRHAN